MRYELRVTPFAQSQIDEFAKYLGAYSEAFAREQIDRLDRVLAANVVQAPHTWGFFPLTGAPYRSYLFRVGRRTQYWIVYVITESERTVDVLHFWNAMRDPERFEFE
jgi:plasmid stabilization system protein ParE